MPDDLDLEPGEYRERKPRGWRWRLPWSHPDDTKLPLVMMLVALGWLGFFFVNLPDNIEHSIVIAMTMFAFLAGIMFTLWLRD